MSVGAKICGITTTAALDAAIDGGARYIGLVFFPKSPRHLDLDTAKRLADHARGKVKIVALVVDADDDELSDIIAHAAPDLFQLHGKETPERVRAIRERFGLPVIKAIAVETAGDVCAAEAYAGIAELILFDAKAPQGAALPGGNGLAFDWRALAAVPAEAQFMLAGGLTADNVADAIRLTGATLVDVSSGVESAPGIKDPALIRRFLAAVKTAKQR